MRKNGVLTYLHGAPKRLPLGSTIVTTNSSGNFNGQEWYHAYGRYRGGHELGTAPSGHLRFTAPKGPEAGRSRVDVLQCPGLKPQADTQFLRKIGGVPNIIAKSGFTKIVNTSVDNN